ncbi:phage terminase large subunit [Thermoactinomyces sp. DSM 45892]|uniref:phage terminase large subunit n=1 Tax=Thermoactinomyces sp. DSM 45892 TaxID=1882753 RepID=UPI00089859FA|nr:phage terminase large subunit [Thermoactinomyces sp. DSM 45892]SDZ04966.1 phage uncharacterized protein (putative large terminase), C-terminal domain-containing protein [Thermoactinomyces sp. DSM 45892]
MAYINGEWLNRQERDERIQLVTDRLRKLRDIYQNGQATDHHIDMMLDDKQELERLTRIHRAEYDTAYFAYEYLSDQDNPLNEDNIIRNGDDGTPHQPLTDLAPIHREFFDLCDYVDHTDPSARLAIAAPRGHSKSGMFSNCFPLHQIVYRKRPYILIISETDSLSKKLISWSNKQLKFNEKLRQDFGELLNIASTKNEKDNEEAFITSTNCLVEASSAGKQLRGKRHGAHRPSLVLIDDPSSINNEGTKEAREKLIEWFNSVVMPIGSKSTAFVLVGTMVTSTGLLSHTLKRKDFRKSFHDAIQKEPDFPELWDEYLQVYQRSEEMDEVDDFYDENRVRLESGVETAWGWRWNYRDLMHAKANMGTRSFNSEYRNRAFSEDEQFFKPDQFAYYRYKTNEFGERTVMFEGKEYRLGDMTISGAWDIAMGKTSRGCYNAFLTVGRHESSGYIFVLDEYSSKEQPHSFMETILQKIRQFNHHIVSVETINAQHEFYRQLMERARIEGLYSTRIQDVKSHKSSKEQRIESLEPYCSNRTLVFNDNHRTLLEQMEMYPQGDYVDSIDALQLSVENVARERKKVVLKPYWL